MASDIDRRLLYCPEIYVGGAIFLIFYLHVSGDWFLYAECQMLNVGT